MSITVLGLLAGGCSGQVAGTQAEGPLSTNPRATVENIVIHEKAGEVSLRVETSEKVTYSAYQQEEPLRLILELPRTRTGEYTRNIPINLGNVSFIKPVMTKRGDCLLEVFLRGPSVYDIDSQGKTVQLKIIPSSEGEEEIGGSPAAVIEEAKAVPEEPIEVLPLEEDEAEPEALSEPADPVEQEVETGTPQIVTAAPEPAALEPAPEPAPEPASAQYVIGLDVQRDPGGTLATIKGDGRLNYEYFLVEGKSLVIDVFDVGNKIWPTVHKVDDDHVVQIRIGEHFQPEKKVRVVFDLKKPGDYSVSRGNSRIAVAFGEPQEPAPVSAEAAPLHMVEEVYFRPLEGKSRIEIKTSGKPEFKVVDSEDPLRLIIEVGNAKINPEAQKTLDLENLNRAVNKITAFEYLRDESSAVRVVAQLRETVPFRVTAAGDTIAVDVNGLSSPMAEAAVDEPKLIKPPPAARAVPAAEAPVAEAPAAPAEPTSDTGVKIYQGKRLSLDFIDADVNDILRLIADVSGLNFVAGPEVKGRVTIRLADVPWDQALDIILKTNVPPLAQIQESENIVRVTTLSKIQEEEEAKRRAAEQKIKNLEAQKKLEPLVTRSFKISYASITDIQNVVREFTSERVDQDGLLTVDERTSTIIVRDLKANVDDIARTIEALDAPTPAVVVEARIVEITDTAARELGVQWGGAFFADAAHGNALPFEFPNSIGVGSADASNPFLVNLPASSPTSGIGINFGHIANTLTLDLRLTAMENMDKVRILSTPRVLVVQNETAKINVGQELPIPATDAEGNRTVTWREVGISLEVKPQVTNDQRVFMEIKVAKESQGENVPTTEGLMFSINSRKAETQVLIGDGETAVIGGLTEETHREGEDSVPGLSKVPGLGWLFKSRSRNNRNDELMIFLTPKIVNVL